MRWFTSDIHHMHTNVIKYCNRPYTDVMDMAEKIKETWNSQVAPEDEVYILGDFSLNHNRAFELIKLLNGTKHLIMGNHDTCFWSENKRRRYLENGFAECTKYKTIDLKDGTNVMLSHMPYLNNTTEGIDVRYKEHRPDDKGMILLHGHQHCYYVKSGRMIDVGWDHKLSLYSEDEIIELIKDPREVIDSRITEWYKNRKDDRKKVE